MADVTRELGLVKGDDGVGISSFEKTSTTGLVDTYTLTLTNGDKKTINVTNGADGDPGQPGNDGNPGKDALINGVNSIRIQEGANITLTQEGDILTISSSGGGGGSTVLPTGNEWLRKTDVTHPEWGYEYEYYKWLPKLPDASGVGWDMIKDLGTTVTQLFPIHVIGTTNPSATHQNKYDNYQGVTAAKEAVHCYAQMGKVDGVFGVYLHATAPFKDYPIQVFFKYFDTTDHFTTQAAMLLSMGVQPNGSAENQTQQLNHIGVD